MRLRRRSKAEPPARPFGYFLERPLPLWQQIAERPEGWSIHAMQFGKALGRGQAR